MPEKEFDFSEHLAIIEKSLVAITDNINIAHAQRVVDKNKIRIYESALKSIISTDTTRDNGHSTDHLLEYMKNIARTVMSKNKDDQQAQPNTATNPGHEFVESILDTLRNDLRELTTQGRTINFECKKDIGTSIFVKVPTHFDTGGRIWIISTPPIHFWPHDKP
jgi:hypothetical protein